MLGKSMVLPDACVDTLCKKARFIRFIMTFQQFLDYVILTMSYFLQISLDILAGCTFFIC